MDINEVCAQYESEKDEERKKILKQFIIKYCNDNLDATIPQIASKVYLEYLCGM